MSSSITPEEREQARRYVEEHLGFSVPPLKGRDIAVKLWVRKEDIVLGVNPEGQEIRLSVPQTMGCDAPLHGCVGLVVGLGQDCPEDGIQVGDFVLMPRYEGTACQIKGVPLRVISSEQLYGVIQDPACITL
jgi:hypothetical protein